MMTTEIDEVIKLLQELKEAATKCVNVAIVAEANSEVRTYKGAIYYYIRACNHPVKI